MRFRKIIVLFCVLWLFVMAYACVSPTPTTETASKASATPNITVFLPDSYSQEVVLVEEEIISQDNCDGLVDLENSVEVSWSVAHTLHVDAEFAVSPTGEVSLPDGVASVNLGNALASQFGHTYGSSQTGTKTVMLKTLAGTRIDHVIQTKEIWAVGIAQVIVNDRTYDIPFSFRTDFHVDHVRDISLPCSDNVQTPVSAGSPPTLAEQLPTSTPVATETPESNQIETTTIINNITVVDGDIFRVEEGQLINHEGYDEFLSEYSVSHMSQNDAGQLEFHTTNSETGEPIVFVSESRDGLGIIISAIVETHSDDAIIATDPLDWSLVGQSSGISVYGSNKLPLKEYSLIKHFLISSNPDNTNDNTPSLSWSITGSLAYLDEKGEQRELPFTINHIILFSTGFLPIDDFLEKVPNEIKLGNLYKLQEFTTPPDIEDIIHYAYEENPFVHDFLINGLPWILGVDGDTTFYVGLRTL